VYRGTALVPGSTAWRPGTYTSAVEHTVSAAQCSDTVCMFSRDLELYLEAKTVETVDASS